MLDGRPFESLVSTTFEGLKIAPLYPRATVDGARALGSELLDAGFSGHINSESGHGPWPEGVLRFAGFLKTL